ncbi:MAG: T9SS type A sorting domain-containing protein [Bacteroidales bacterium]|nr:T9SS type A sorting domain-containing protein [Bacteroidales bacterium]
MKKYIYTSIIVGTLLLCYGAKGVAQDSDCVQCTGCTTTGTNASAIGKSNTASGNNAFAGGYNSVASGSNSMAFGYSSIAAQSTNIALGNAAQATGIGATAIGTYVKASAQNSFVIGAGATTSNPFTNSTPYSIALGVNSNKPTMLITKALNNNYTGKVAIGPITSPQTKLHIKSDSNEDSGIFIETTNKTTKKAFINLFDASHNLTVEPSGNLFVNSGKGMLGFSGDHYCFGGNSELKTRIYTNDTRGLYFNARRDRNNEVRDGIGPSYAIVFNNDNLCFKTAEFQEPRRESITNWKESLFLCSNGKVGIGSKNTYLENKGDETLVLHSPQEMDLQSSSISLNGKIGINTTNTVSDYALAVNGGIISTKVFIKEANQWPDFVFTRDYPLMDLNELEAYVSTNKHLPGVPSETEIIRDGYDLHQMQCTLMEKIEEMTRYILVLKQEIDSLKATSPSLDHVQFTYDECGNRVSRSLLIEQLPKQGENPLQPEALAYTIFPNPTSGQFSVVMKEPNDGTPLQMTLRNVTGSIIEHRFVHSSQTSFDLSKHAQGIYILEINTNEGSQAWKIVKQ